MCKWFSGCKTFVCFFFFVTKFFGTFVKLKWGPNSIPSVEMIVWSCLILAISVGTLSFYQGQVLGKNVFFLLEEIKIFSSYLLSSLCLVYSCMWKRKVFPTQYASAPLCEFKCTSPNHVLLFFYFPPFWFSSVRRDGIQQKELRRKSLYKCILKWSGKQFTNTVIIQDVCTLKYFCGRGGILLCLGIVWP